MKDKGLSWDGGVRGKCSPSPDVGMNNTEKGDFPKQENLLTNLMGGELLLLGRNILGRYDKNRFEEQSTIPCSDSMHQS